VPTRLLLEGSDIQQLLAQIRDEHGPSAKIISADQVRNAGLAGLFGRPRYELTIEVEDDPGQPTAPPGAGPGAAPGTGPGTGPGVGPGTGPGVGPGAGPGVARADGSAATAPQRADASPAESLLALVDAQEWSMRPFDKAATGTAGAPLPSANTPAVNTPVWGPAPAMNVPMVNAPAGAPAPTLNFAQVLAGFGLPTPISAPPAPPAAPAAPPAAAGPPVAPVGPVPEFTRTGLEQFATITLPGFAPLPTAVAATGAPPAATPPTPPTAPAAPQPTVAAPAAPQPTAAEPAAPAAIVSPASRTPRDPSVRLRTALARLGMPPDLLDRIDDTDSYLALVRLLDSLPPAAQAPTGAGEVLVVVGELASAAAVAGTVSQTLGLPLARTLVAAATIAGTGIHPSRRLADPEHAADRVARLREGDSPLIVVVDAPADGTGSEWARAMVQALDPTVVWAVADATRKAPDTRRYLSGLGRVDALAVHAVAVTADPATVLALDAPVVLLDGQPATAHGWAALLCRRMAEAEP